MAGGSPSGKSQTYCVNIDDASKDASDTDVNLVMYNRFANPDYHLNIEKVKVSVCVTFLKIGEIDTLKEQYHADVMVKAKWREAALDKSNLEGSATIDWSKYWQPKLFIENTIGEPRENAVRTVLHNHDGQAFVVEKRRIKGLFLENLELMDFPFDVQDLTVTVMSERSVAEVEIVEDPDEMHNINRQSFIDEQEWLLYKCIEAETREVTNEYSDPPVRRSSLLVKCRAARRPAYFFWNIFLITFLISSLSFATFSVDRRLPQNRLQLTFTLVLTSVAFKFVVNQSLPRISYLTYLDKYVLAAMIMLSTVCAWHGLATVFGQSVVGDAVDRGAFIMFSAVYIVCNIAFVIHIYATAGLKRRIMRKKERNYIDRINKHHQKSIEGRTKD